MTLDCIAEISYKPLGNDRGEDAYSFDCTRRDLHALAVFDGCGGSGAWKYPEFKNLSGAFVAAQTIAKQFLDWYSGLSSNSVEDVGALANSFYECTQQTLTNIKNSCKPMGVSGSLVKSFPCTASCAIISKYDKNSLLLSALNVGDSRVYFLTPSNGLVQFTKDDSRGNPDPLDSLRDNAPLSNLLNADKPYKVRTTQEVVSLPCAFVCATDGVFGFVRSPMDFELMLIESIMQAQSIKEFEDTFQQKIVKLTGDDSTCLIAFYGWGSYECIKKSFQKRYSYILKMIDSIDAVVDPIDQENLIQRYWKKYKLQTVYSEMQG